MKARWKMKKRKPRVAQIKLDNRRFKNRRGKWIVDLKGSNAPAEEWQLERLIALGCPPENIKDVRFHVANQLIGKLTKARANERE